MKRGSLAKRRRIIEAAGLALLAVYGLRSDVAGAVDAVDFSAATVGTSKSIGTWGVDTAWPDAENAAQSINFIGINNVKAIRVCFDVSQPITQNGNGTFSLDATAQQEINAQLALAAMANPGTPLTFVPTGYGSSTTNSMYLSGSGINPTTWAEDIEATQQYINSQAGFTNTRISSIEAFNEPDYSSGEGTAAQLNTVIEDLKAYGPFANTAFVGASTLDSDNAESWYSQIPAVTQGSSHLLGGSLTSYVNFIQDVNASGKSFTNPEMHSLAEAIVGANYGQAEGIFWADADQARGLFAQVSSSGKQIAYSQDLNNQSAAAVYRASNGQTYAFAGGLERFGAPTSYEFVSDRAAYINGIGPIKSYTLQTDYDNDPATSSNDIASFGAYFSQGAYATVDYGSASMPALDGYRWEIENVATGQMLAVRNNSTASGGGVDTGYANGSLGQLWNVTRTQDGYLELFNANSSLALDDVNGSSANGTAVDQYAMTGENQQWYLTSAGNGEFYIQNFAGMQYLTGSAYGCTTNSLSSTSPAAQEWKFVLDNPSSPAIANYQFKGNGNDSSAGGHNATVSGTATYTAGPTTGSQALIFDGSSTYVTLPSGVTANTTAITVDTWVKWNGGSAWQRIFDFGTGTNSYMFLTPDSGAGTMRFGITTAGNTNEEDLDTSELVTGQWVNVALTLGGQTAILYLNGRPVTAGQILFNPSEIAATQDYIGKSQFAGDPLFNGMMSNFSVYDYALDMSQIDDLLNNNLTWAGGQNGNTWDAGTTANFSLMSTGASSVFNQGDRVTFDGTGTSSVVIPGTVSPFSITVTGGSNTTFSGAGSIGGSGTTLTMSGTGTLTIANTGGNSFTGDTTINSGTISISADNDLGTDASNLNLNGGTLQTTSTNAMVFGHSILVAPAGGALSIIGNGSATTGQGDRVILAAANMLIGGGALTVSGDGTLAGAGPNTTTAGAGALVLNNSNTFSGNLTLQGGGLVEFAAASALDPSATITLGNEGEFSVANGVSSSNAIMVNGGTNSVISFNNSSTGTVAGAITLNANATVGLRDWYNYGDVRGGTISGVISGSGGLTVNSGTGSGGVLTLSGANTFTGNVTVNSSTVDAANGQNVAARTSGALGNASVAGRTVTINSGSTLNFTVGNVLGSGGSAASQAPELSIVVNAGGTLETTASAVGTVASGNTGQGDANIFGPVTLNGGSFVAGNGYDGDYRAAILMGTITVGGTSPSTMSTNGAYAAGNGFMLGGMSAGINPITFDVGATGSGGADLTVSGILTDAAGSVSNSAIKGALIKTGAGTMVLSGANTYSGGSTVNGGALVLDALAQAPVLSNGGANVEAGELVFNYSGGSDPVALVRSDLAASYNAAGGAFSSGQIYSSTAAADRYGLGYVDNSASDQLTVMYTLYGDTNLDGSVNFADLLTVAQYYGDSNTDWAEGDFNYDGSTNFSDLLLLAQNYDQSLSSNQASELDQIDPSFVQQWEIALQEAAVPEPGALGMLGIAAVVLMGWRRRRRRCGAAELGVAKTIGMGGVALGSGFGCAVALSNCEPRRAVARDGFGCASGM